MTKWGANVFLEFEISNFKYNLINETFDQLQKSNLGFRINDEFDGNLFRQNTSKILILGKHEQS